MSYDKWGFLDYLLAIIYALLGAGLVVFITLAATRPPTPHTIVGVLGEAHCCVVRAEGYGSYSLLCENDTVISGATNFVNSGKPCE